MTTNRTAYTLQTNLQHLLREAEFSPMNPKDNHNVTPSEGHVVLNNSTWKILTVHIVLNLKQHGNTDFSNGFVHSSQSPTQQSTYLQYKIILYKVSSGRTYMSYKPFILHSVYPNLKLSSPHESLYSQP